MISLDTYACIALHERVWSDLPYEIAAEYETQHEDKDPCAKDNHIDIERQVLEGYRWHSAGLIGVDESQTAEAPYTQSNNKTVIYECNTTSLK